MSQITDLLSRVKQAEQKKGVPPGLTAAMDSPRRRHFGNRRAVLLGVAVVSAVALGVFTLYVAGSLNKSAPVAAPEAGQMVATAQGNVEKDAPASPAAKHEASSTSRPEKDGAPLAQASGKKTKAQAAIATLSDMSPRSKGNVKALRDERPADGREFQASSADRVAHELYLAGNYESAGDNASAIASYAKAIELDPGNYKAMNNVASILLKAGSTAEAIPYIKGSLAARADYVPALVNMGIALAGQGSAQEAEVWFGKALSIEPASVPALLNMAVLYERNGQEELAGEYYGKLKSLGHPEGAAGLKRLR